MQPRTILATCLLIAQFLFAAPFAAAEVIPIDDDVAQKIFQDAKAKAGFWQLMHYFESQVDQTYCGVASAAIVLNSLDVAAPASPAIHPYRRFDQSNFFTESVLGVKSPKYVHLSGLTLDELGKMLELSGVDVAVHHAAPPLDLDGFRTIAAAALADPKSRIIVNFHRKYIGQDGAGHHSPLAAYDATSDRFLLLDVARYRLPPVWVPAADLWASMNTEDSDAKANRGFLVIRTK
ncbi:MAG: phytochelatin synthase family protein [Rhodospirillaceae bacterium]